jgi:hypothetical protein
VRVQARVAFDVSVSLIPAYIVACAETMTLGSGCSAKSRTRIGMSVFSNKSWNSDRNGAPSVSIVKPKKL